MYNDVYIMIGSNIDPVNNINRAVCLLKDLVTIRELSFAWETRAVGSSGPNFINVVLHVTTGLNGEELKRNILQPVENQLGRVRTADKNAPRTMDLDILIFNGELMENRLWSEAYLALPMSELCPDFQHPLTGKKPASNI